MSITFSFSTPCTVSNGHIVAKTDISLIYRDWILCAMEDHGVPIITHQDWMYSGEISREYFNSLRRLAIRFINSPKSVIGKDIRFDEFGNCVYHDVEPEARTIKGIGESLLSLVDTATKSGENIIYQ